MLGISTPAIGLSLLFAACLALTPTRAMVRAEMRDSVVVEQVEKARKLFYSANYDGARAIYEAALQKFPAASTEDKASLLMGVGTCHLARGQLNLAQKYYNLAAGAAEQAPHLSELHLAIATNRATLYRRMGDEQAAKEVWRGTDRLIQASRNPLQISQFANSIRATDPTRALGIFQRALEVADSWATGVAEGQGLRATIWSQIGVVHWQRNDLAAAEDAFVESYRLRLMSGKLSGLQTTYAQLGVLRRLAGDLRSSRTLLQRARALVAEGSTPLTLIENQLGRTALESGDRELALKHFGAAVEAARQWRLQMLPAERFRVSNELTSRNIFEDYVSTSLELFEHRADARLLDQAFEAAEQSRTFLFQQALGAARTLPNEYWTLLSRYRTLLIRTLGNSDPALAQEAETVRLRLAELEAQFGIESQDAKKSPQTSERKAPSSALLGLQEKLREQEAFLSFYSGEKKTYLWAVTRASSEVRELPGSPILSKKIEAFRRLLLRRDGNAKVAGAELAALLLGQTSGAIRQKREWILSLDGPLFQLPFAALPVGDQWLGQVHTLRTVPGVPAQKSEQPKRESWEFYGWGDPIYNRADARWNGTPPLRMDIELERLAGTADEVATCARSWKHDGSPQMFFGPAVGRNAVLDGLGRGPAVFHLATHVLPHPEQKDGLLIALGASPEGEQQFLSAAEIAALKTTTGLVVLSGCGSGRGESVPGIGLFGLIRSFLVGGANSVVATYWPIPDDDGALLSEMYRRLSTGGDVDRPAAVARALQAAQAKMIADGGPRSHPAYWSAFAVSGKE